MPVLKRSKRSPTEASAQERLITLCNGLARGRLFAVKVEAPGLNGFPDVQVFVWPGFSIFVEMKKPGEKPRKLQIQRIELLQAHGFHAFWSDDPDDALTRIVRICKERGVRL